MVITLQPGTEDSLLNIKVTIGLEDTKTDPPQIREPVKSKETSREEPLPLQSLELGAGTSRS